jgi:hypothetical protein
MFTLTITQHHTSQGGDKQNVEVVKLATVADNIDILGVISAFQKPVKGPRSDKGTRRKKTAQQELIP